MCRLLGVVAQSPAPLAALLDGDLEQFLGLAADHADGWGVGYAEEAGRIVVLKEAVRADISDMLRPAVKRCVTDLALLHLRLASLNLPVTAANTHPFGDSWCAFAHNGYFTPASALDATLGADGVAAVGGDTDSERYYTAIRRRIAEGADPAVAIAGAAAAIRELAAEWASLNCLLITGEALYAYADHDPDSEVVGRRGRDFFDLSYRIEPGRVVVASQGWPQPAGPWTRLPRRRVLEVTRRDLSVTVHPETC
jgi:predicted glutamine amidotransferase